MKKIKNLEITLIIILIIISLLSISQIIITSNTIIKTPSEFGYTKAICNETNYCEDYIIECEGNKVKKLTPTGFSIQHDSDWIDPRKETKNYCE